MEYGAARQSAEWGNRGFQAAYPRLNATLPAEPSAWRSILLETAVLLYNLRTRKIGLNQIQTVWWNGLRQDAFEFLDL